MTETLKDIEPDIDLFYNAPSSAYFLREARVIGKYSSWKTRHPFTHKNVHFWYIVEAETGKRYAVGYNENPAIGISYPFRRWKKDAIPNNTYKVINCND